MLYAGKGVSVMYGGLPLVRVCKAERRSWGTGQGLRFRVSCTCAEVYIYPLY